MASQRRHHRLVPAACLCLLLHPKCAAAPALEHMNDATRFRIQHAGDELRLFPAPRAGMTGWLRRFRVHGRRKRRGGHAQTPVGVRTDGGPRGGWRKAEANLGVVPRTTRSKRNANLMFQQARFLSKRTAYRFRLTSFSSASKNSASACFAASSAAI